MIGRSVNRVMTTIGSLLLFSLVTGCTNTDMSDLQAFIQQVEAKQPGKIPPLPEFKTAEGFHYTSFKKKDPFTPWISRANTPANGKIMTITGGVQPNVKRKKQALESYPLDSLSMVGTLQYGGEPWAIIKAPDNKVHRVKVGSYIGQNYGRVTRVAESGLGLREIIPDGLGGWREQDATLSQRQ